MGLCKVTKKKILNNLRNSVKKVAEQDIIQLFLIGKYENFTRK